MRALIPIVLAFAPVVAHAQAAVTVEVRSPEGTAADGRVTLTSASGETYACETTGGSCTIAGVGGGRYVVRLAPRAGGEPPEPRAVMIPPSGSVTLRVSTH